MRTAQLNSGSFKKYTAIGQDGSPVWHNAEAFRSALARDPKVGPKYANFLSEPKFNESNDRVDWYIPFESTRDDGQYSIISWNSASPQEKRQALSKLNEFEEKMTDFGLDIQARALTGDSKLFAHFLTGSGGADELPAIRFPDESCIFIVDGQPVITFWGFVNPGTKPTGSPFAPLRTGLSGAAGSAAGSKSAGKKGFSLWWLLLIPLLLLLLLAAYLLWHFLKAPAFSLGSVFPDLGNFSLDPVPSVFVDEKQREDLQKELDKIYGIERDNNGNIVIDGNRPADNVTVDGRTDLNIKDLDGAALPADNTATEVAVPDGTVPELLTEAADGAEAQAVPDGTDTSVDGKDGASVDNVPVEVNPDGVADAADAQTAAEDPQNASADGNLTPAAAPDAAQGSVPEELSGNGSDNQNNASGSDASNSAAPDVKPLELSDSDVSSQNLGVIDGKWSSRSGLVDSKTGKPVNVQYEFKDGKGTATVTRIDGSKCVGQTSGKFNNGALEIEAASEAKCSDGNGYALPKVICKNDNGKTRCQGAYSDNTRLNMELYK